METKTYKGDGFAVVWKPGTCIHSTLCWKNLRNVFDPFKRPWITLENGTKEEIKERVMACPSGALVWQEESAETEAPAPVPAVEQAYVEIRPDGPLLVKGEVLLIHPDGKREFCQQPTALCRCGGSANKPFCDGSHRKIGFKG